MRTTRAALAAVTAGGLLAAALGPSTASTGEQRGSGAAEAQAAPGKVGFGLPAWTVRPGEHETTVRVRYPSDDPPVVWDGQPVEIQVRLPDGSWTTVGEADQKPAPGRAGSRTKLPYTLPIDGEVELRARAFSTESSLTSPVRTLQVEPDTPAYDPTALRGTQYYCWDPVIARNPSRIAYGCPTGGEYEYNTWLYNARTDERERLDTYTDYPDFASDADVMIGESLVYSGEDFESYRVRRYDLDNGTSRWVAFKRNGKRARIAHYSSITANGNRIAYSSYTRGIAPRAPKGENVYVVTGDSKKSRYVGRGDGSDIAAFGRYVVWRNHQGKIRRHDLRTHRTMSVTTSTGHKPDSPDVSAGGRYVTFSTKHGNRRFVRIFDAKTDTLRRIAEGRSPTISDNGRYVAYVAKAGRELYVWDRKTAETELLTVGPSGEGSGAGLDVPDISPNGRWVVAAIDTESDNGANVAPDNGRRYAKNGIVLFDRKAP